MIAVRTRLKNEKTTQARLDGIVAGKLERLDKETAGVVQLLADKRTGTVSLPQDQQHALNDNSADDTALPIDTEYETKETAAVTINAQPAP